METSRPTLLVLAAGMGSRYGGLKQVDPVGPSGEIILDYSVYDALKAGFGRVVFVIREELESVFRESIGDRIAPFIEVDYAFQRLEDLPGQHTLPASRKKPWGTAHAVLAAREVVREPFLVINADDFYGFGSYELVARFLGNVAPHEARYALVPYHVGHTLSEHGSVSRGLCKLDEKGNLVSIREILKLEAAPDGGATYEEHGEQVHLPPDAPVSMNMWGFTPCIFEEMLESFDAFLAAHGEDPKAEFLIPEIVERAIRSGRGTFKAIVSDEDWIGITYPEDKAAAVEAVSGLVAAGRYPSPLWATPPASSS